MFAQPLDHSFNDLFNQYVNMDSLSADGNKDVPFSADLDQIFPLDLYASNCGDHSHSPTISTRRLHQSPQPWGTDLWCLSQDAAASATHGALAFQGTVHPSAVSDLNLNLDVSAPAEVCRSSSRSPSTPPATPSRKATKSALNTPKSIRRHRDPHDRRAFACKQSFSPSLMRSSQVQKGRMAYPEAWAQRLQSFTFRTSGEDMPLSPPPSDILVQHENVSADNSAAQMNHSTDEMPHHYDSSIFNHSPAISMPSPSANAMARQQQQQQQQHGYLSQSNSSALTTSSPPSDDIFSSPHSSDPQSMSSWHSDALASTGLPFTPDLQSHDAQAWWSPMASRVPQRQPSYQHMVASPVPQRPIPNTNHDIMQGGLMIQFDTPAFDMSATADSSFHHSSTMPPAPQETHSYNQIPAAPQKFLNNTAYATPQVTPQLNHSSRSPSMSPRGGSSPMNGSIMRNGANMKTPQRRTHTRKLSGQSINTPKPVSRPSGPSGSPKGSKSVTVSFVNFTPNDSHKILSGVAPSGSSKTKARREQEARDRRRKLSEAALNAVRKAGGDVEALEAVLC